MCWAMNTSIKAFQEIQRDNSRKAKDPPYYVYEQWRRASRLMYLNYPAISIHLELYNILSEVAEETNENFKLPNLKREKRKIDPSAVKISGEIKISDVAKKYGLDINQGRSKCPFHEGSNPTSFSLNDKKGLFGCFSCGIKGDIIKFVQLMENEKNK